MSGDTADNYIQGLFARVARTLPDLNAREALLRTQYEFSTSRDSQAATADSQGGVEDRVSTNAAGSGRGSSVRSLGQQPTWPSLPANGAEEPLGYDKDVSDAFHAAMNTMTSEGGVDRGKGKKKNGKSRNRGQVLMRFG